MNADNKNSYPILAKPSGVTLDEHRQHVMVEASVLAKYCPFTFKKYQELVGKSLEKRLEIVAKLHDDGKDDEQTTNKWQIACRLDYQNFIHWQQVQGGSFAEYSAKKPNEAGYHLRKAGIRHEIQSLVRNEKKNLPICLKAAIAAHHGKLGFRFEDAWIRSQGEKLWKEFRRHGNIVIDEQFTLQQVVTLHYEFAGPRGFLQLADHRASATEDGEWVPEHTVFKYHFPHSEKRNVQKLVERHWEEDILLLRAATGAGKTDACLLWAAKQIENCRAERLIIAMPTRFTSNALSINISDQLSQVGLYHSSSWFNKFHENVETGNILKKDASKEHEFARLLQTPVTVCTIDHLLMALTLTREDHHLITFNLANSCLVIDEADFYDEFTHANIMVMLEFLKYWKVPILLMSASLPESVLPLYRKFGLPVLDIKEDNLDQEDYIRTKFKVECIKSCEMPEDIDELLSLAVQQGNAIIYANTIERALHLFEWFSRKALNIEVCLYHSQFTEPDKARKETQLVQMLGKEAWDSGNAHGIAILTQIGEMSINISADLMITDLCPIDRLTQRTGRLARFNKQKIGKLYVLVPKKKNCLYPAPYGSYDRKMKKWISCDSFKRTHEILDCGEYSVSKLIKMLNEVYDTTTEFTAKAITNARSLKEYFTTNWLINSNQISDKDDSGVNFWLSRDIPPQEIIFIEKPPSHFTNYLAFQSWKLQYSIEISAYLVAKGRKNHLIETATVSIREEEDTINVLKNGCYTFLKGVDLNPIESIF